MLRIFFILLCSLGSNLIWTQEKLPQSTQDKIDQLFAPIGADEPGYAIGVIKDQKWVVQQGFGQGNLEYELALTAQSVFNVASLSKQFTAAAIALLILDDKLSLEDKVVDLLPHLPAHTHALQVKHLVYMTSGLPEYYNLPRSNGTDWSSLHYFSIDTAITTVMQQGALNFEPGTRWSYSNIDYQLLTKIVEAVSGERFATFVRRRIFKPLGMTQSRVNDDLFEVIPQRVVGYNHRTPETVEQLANLGYLNHRDTTGFIQVHRHSPHYGGSGVYTSLSDLKKWFDNFESRSFGGDAFYELMHQTMKFEHDKQNDAFGLVHGDFNGRPIVWYEGGDWGFSSYFMRFPEDQLTVICLSNLGEGRAQSYAHRLMDILDDDEIFR